jgi:predicted TIM-barrel fold metal-dependent hydrolase
MDIYDFHAHIYPEKIREKAIESVSDNYTINIDCDGKADTLITDCKEAGINHFVALSVAQSAKHVESINDFALSLQENYEEIDSFGSIHPDYEEPEKELERIFKSGIKGIKIHPDSQGFKVDDERMFPIYDTIRALRLPLMIHCGDYRFDYDNPERVAKVIDEFPGLTIIAAHFGGWLLYDRALDALKDKKCYLDCSSSMMYLGKRRSKELIRAYGAERMLYVSDYPMWNPATELETLRSLGLESDELELMLHINAERILKGTNITY